MTIIKGTHSKPGQVEAVPTLDSFAADITAHAERTFNYLTIDAALPPSDAFLPDTNQDEMRTVLLNLAEVMVENAIGDTRNSKIPAICTYWGQFIDHDITAGTNAANNTEFNLLDADILDPTFKPAKPKTVVESLFNLRHPRLDLDAVYGHEDGADDPATAAEGIFEDDKIRLKLGINHLDPNDDTFDEDRIPEPKLDEPFGGIPHRDLPRHPDKEPRVGDGRNDENTIVSQFHTAFLHFHNKVVAWLQKNPDVLDDEIFPKHDLFSVARQIVRWTHQYLVVNDYLMHVAKPYIVQQLAKETTPSFFKPNQEFMPLEFSAAAFRFGHSMVRDDYDFNMNFGDPTGHKPGDTFQLPTAPLGLLFVFTGKGGFNSTPEKPINTLPVNWIIQWDRFTQIPADKPFRAAQKIDTNLAFNLGNLIRESEIPTDTKKINKHLARRNLLRGYLLSIPTGQHVAKHLGLPPLTTELLPENAGELQTFLNDKANNVLLEKTPLWYYVLREAELNPQINKAGGDGNSLGDVGSHIVAGTLIGLIKADPDSYINAKWTPDHATAAVRLPNGAPVKSILEFFQFAGVATIPELVPAAV